MALAKTYIVKTSQSEMSVWSKCGMMMKVMMFFAKFFGLI